MKKPPRSLKFSFLRENPKNAPYFRNSTAEGGMYVFFLKKVNRRFWNGFVVNFLKLFFFWEERERGKGKGLGSAFRSQEGEDKGRTGYLYFPEKFTVKKAPTSNFRPFLILCLHGQQFSSPFVPSSALKIRFRGQRFLPLVIFIRI